MKVLESPSYSCLVSKHGNILMITTDGYYIKNWIKAFFTYPVDLCLWEKISVRFIWTCECKPHLVNLDYNAASTLRRARKSWISFSPLKSVFNHPKGHFVFSQRIMARLLVYQNAKYYQYCRRHEKLRIEKTSFVSH